MEIIKISKETKENIIFNTKKILEILEDNNSNNIADIIILSNSIIYSVKSSIK